MQDLRDTLDRETKVPGRKIALDWCCLGMLGVQIALLPAWLRDAHSSEEKVFASEAGKLF